MQIRFGNGDQGLVLQVNFVDDDGQDYAMALTCNAACLFRHNVK